MDAEKLFIGIDTSCYTTSVAVITEDGAVQFKKMLSVKEGGCGLRQSDALFQHIQNMPELFDELKKQFSFKDYSKIFVTVSTRPRSVEGSYMPVFTAGRAFARTVADVLGAKYREVSHQDGHIMAAIYSSRKYSILEKSFLAYHLSGGTCELLLVKRCGAGFECEIVGGTLDLPAGQFIDRIGVEIGMSFPCGRYMDYSAMEYDGEKPKVKNCVKGAYINFSGEETRYRRLLAEGENPERVAYCVMKCIADSVKKSVLSAKEEFDVENVLMVGGVSASCFLREAFSDVPNVYFAEAALSTDNAVGVCELGRLAENEEGSGNHA